MVTESGFIHEQAPGHYTWSHDKIREAAYSLIPVPLIESLHLLVGTRIYIKTEDDQIADRIFVIVRNMNMGLRCLDAENLKAELAHLNFIAGRKSAEQSAFHSATNYFVVGLGLLGEDWHALNYKLGMKLYNAAAEALLVTGNTALFKSVIDKPITHARNLEDRLAVSYTLVRFLASTGEIDEASSKCFAILREIGEEFSSDVTPQDVLSNLVKTKDVLSKYSEKDFSSLPLLKAPLKLWAMEFMQIACRIAFYRKPEMILLIGCRIIRTSAVHGWCSTSAFGLSTFGHGLISMNEIDEGHYW
jgi:predicted ATPase